LVVAVVVPMQARAESPPQAEDQADEEDEPQVEPVPSAQPRPYAAPPQSYAPPVYAPPSYPAPGYPPAGFGPPPLLAYDSARKYPALGLLLEIFVPGLGSVYADHPGGAAATWGLMLGGVGMIAVGLSQQETHGDVSGPTNAGISMAFTGLVMVVCGRVYGLIDSWSSSTDYNVDLAARLGIAQGSVIVAPVKAPDGRMAWGPSLSLRF
jgi:hypothetical protein